MLRIFREKTSVNPDTIFTVGNFNVANTTLTSVLILLIFIIFSFIIVRKYKERPNKSQTIVELLIQSMLDFIKQITGSEKYAKSLFPLIASLFIYIGLSNLISLIPGLMSLTYNDFAIFRSPTTDFNTTFGLALGSVVLTQVVSIKDYGIFGHLDKYFKFRDVYLGFKKGINNGVMAIIDFIIGLLDIVSEIAKVISLSLRLFGNMYAGEILATLILGSFAYFIPIIWTSMSMLSGVIQAVVFGSLTTAYYMLAVKIKEGEEET